MVHNDFILKIFIKLINPKNKITIGDYLIKENDNMLKTATLVHIYNSLDKNEFIRKRIPASPSSLEADTTSLILEEQPFDISRFLVEIKLKHIELLREATVEFQTKQRRRNRQQMEEDAKNNVKRSRRLQYDISIVKKVFSLAMKLNLQCADYFDT